MSGQILLHEYALRNPEAVNFFATIVSPQILKRGNTVDHQGIRCKVCAVGKRKHPTKENQSQRTATLKYISNV